MPIHAYKARLYPHIEAVGIRVLELGSDGSKLEVEPKVSLGLGFRG